MLRASKAGAAFLVAISVLIACREKPHTQREELAANDAGRPDAEVSDPQEDHPLPAVHGVDCRNPGEPVDWDHAELVDQRPDSIPFIGTGAHALRLPYDLPNCDPPPSHIGEMPPCPVGLAPGEEPGPDFPAGTVYLANWAVDNGASVWEWDLARASVRRRLQIRFPDEQCALTLRRTGNVLHLESEPGLGGYGYYAVIRSDLKSYVISRPGLVDVGTVGGLVATDSMGVLFAGGEEDSKPGFIIETFDNQARRVAKRFFLADGYSDVALFQGHLFALLGQYHRDKHGASLELVRLRRDLTTERQSLVPMDGLPLGEGWPYASLFVSHGRLFATVDGPQKVLELSAEGKVLGILDGCAPRDLGSSRAETWVGHVHVLAHDKRLLDWSDSGDPPPVPCPGVP